MPEYGQCQKCRQFSEGHRTKSEGENQTCGWHGSMGELVHAQWAQPEIGDFVDEASVFRANCYVHCERHISAGPVYERSSGLLAHGVGVAGIEDHGTATG